MINSRCIAYSLAFLLAVGVGGCATKTAGDDRSGRPELIGLQSIPESAQLLGDNNARLSVSAPREGRIYLYDVDDDRVLWTGRVNSGARFEVDPDADRAAIDGKLTYHRPLVRGHRHRIYFE